MDQPVTSSMNRVIAKAASTIDRSADSPRPSTVSDDQAMENTLLMSDPRVAAVVVRECDEPLVDLRSGAKLRVDQRKNTQGGAFAFVREGVLHRLQYAATLLPQGIQFLVIEGYRPPELQLKYFLEYQSELRLKHPEWSPELLHSATSRYVSPPEVAPHSAGAAIDLTLCTLNGDELDLGTRVNASPEESAGACYMDAPQISSNGARNRAVMSTALGAAGFINYPTEWWHWSIGDRYWATTTNAAHAYYGPAAHQSSDF